MTTIYVATTGNDSTGDGSSGNPYASPGKASGVATASGDIIYLKSGTYTLTTSTPGALGPVIPSNGVRLEGYQTTIGDLGTKPVINAGSVTGITLIGTSSGNYGGVESLVLNIRVDGNSGAGNIGISPNTYAHRVVRCDAVNCATGFFNQSNMVIVGCYAESCTNGFTGGDTAAAFCVAKGCSIGFTAPKLVGCVAYGGGEGFNPGTNWGGFHINCSAFGNSGNGFTLSGGYDIRSVVNCVSWNNGGYGFDDSASSMMFVNCGYGSNTSGNFSNAPNRELGGVSLSADPFTNAAAGDFSLNNVAGGGALLRAAGFPGVFPGGLTTGYLDIGAVQHADPAATGGASYIIRRGGLSCRL